MKTKNRTLREEWQLLLNDYYSCRNIISRQEVVDKMAQWQKDHPEYEVAKHIQVKC